MVRTGIYEIGRHLGIRISIVETFYWADMFHEVDMRLCESRFTISLSTLIEILNTHFIFLKPVFIHLEFRHLPDSSIANGLKSL